MKLCDEINKLMTPRHANAGSKKLKLDCPDCGTKLPVYVGKYSQKCLGCGNEFNENYLINHTKQVFKFEEVNMKIYFQAVIAIFGKRKAEKWLDDNSDKLSGKAKNIKMAKVEIYKILSKNT